MLPCFFLLFFLCESTVKSNLLTSSSPFTETTGTTAATEERLSPLQLVATPDYPVAVGQRVHLHCTAFTMPEGLTWSWQRWVNQTWEEVDTGQDLALEKPEQSGLYRCHAESPLSQMNWSPNHTVFIVSTHATAGEDLAIAALVFSLLALAINFAVVLWLCYQRLGDTLTVSNAVSKGFPGPEKQTKGGLPQIESDGDVYMNYTNTNQSYTDLDPTNMTEDNVYSSLS